MYDFIIVGGSQAGLAMAYQLKKLNLNILVVDAGNEIGSSWLNRWDSLTLFTPKKYNGLPGLTFEGKREYPNKHDVADYLKHYVATFNLPVQLNTQVTSLQKLGDIYQVETNSSTLYCHNVVVATGPFHKPFTPGFAHNICPSIKQIHSRDYRNTSQLNSGPTLVVGGGDSGVQILSEIADTGCQTYSSGINSLTSLPQVFLGKTLWWWLSSLGILSLSKNSFLGKQIKKRMQPVIGTDVKALLDRENVTSLGRTISAHHKTIQFENRKESSIKNIIWATGYKPDFRWLTGQDQNNKSLTGITFDDEGYPLNKRGVGEVKGMYFIGLPWMHTRGSATLGGVAADSEYLANHIAQQYQMPNKSMVTCPVD